jgi:Na+-translocating ferredoxin:NAD+ oxidoreductase subunit G
MKEIIRLCFVLTLIGAVCAAVMSFVDQQTKAPIVKSLAAEKMDAVKVVIPACDNDLAKSAVTIADKDREMELTFYVGTKGGVPVGAAFSIVATGGYSGTIDLLVGVDTAGAVTGIEILRHAETPGLGSKIATPLFKGQFIGKSVKNPANWSVMKDGGPFKQITGATISSRAVTTAIANGLEFLDAHKAEVFGAGTKSCPKPEPAGGK